MMIDRRRLMGWMGMAGGAALGSPWLSAGKAFALDAATAAAGQTRWERSAQRKQAIASDIQWLTHEPLDFLLRRGDHFADEPDHYTKMVSPDNIKRMADAGVEWGMIFFYKGLGLEYEKPHIDLAQKTVALMHQHGMKACLYFGGTMFTESFYRETPEAVNWEQRDQWNRPVSYGMQTYRNYACLNEMAYRAYLKRVIKIGIEQVGGDEFAFDNIMLQGEPKSCRCPRCVKAFTAFLQKRYPTDEEAHRRFGMPVDWIRPNPWDSEDQAQGITELKDPVLQEWVAFRCATLANYANELHDYTKSLKPNMVCGFNIKGVYSFNRYWTNAVYHPFYAGHADKMSFDTGGYDEHIDATTGALVSQIRSYKAARHIGASCEDSFDNDVRTAVHLSFGYQKPGQTSTPQGSAAFRVFTPLLEFFREYNTRYYTGTEMVSDVAVLRNWGSMAYSVNATYVPATLMEQVLIQHKVPFDLLFDEQLGTISKYGAVVLAGQQCVGDKQAALLLEYVRNGGTLVLTGNTGEYNEWFEEREPKTNPLLPARTEGKGRIVYIPQIVVAKGTRSDSDTFVDPEPGATSRRGSQMSPSQWVLPKNHEEIHAAIVGAMSKGLSLTTDAPLTTVMELLNRAESKETIVHFVNFDKKNPTAPFAVTLRKQYPGAVKTVTLISPDTEEQAKLTFDNSGDSIKFTVPATRLYNMIVVAHA